MEEQSKPTTREVGIQVKMSATIISLQSRPQTISTGTQTLDLETDNSYEAEILRGKPLRGNGKEMKATFYLNRNGRMKQRRTLSERFHEMNHNKDTSGSVLDEPKPSMSNVIFGDVDRSMRLKTAKVAPTVSGALLVLSDTDEKPINLLPADNETSDLDIMSASSSVIHIALEGVTDTKYSPVSETATTSTVSVQYAVAQTRNTTSQNPLRNIVTKPRRDTTEGGSSSFEFSSDESTRKHRAERTLKEANKNSVNEENSLAFRSTPIRGPHAQQHLAQSIEDKKTKVVLRQKSNTIVTLDRPIKIKTTSQPLTPKPQPVTNVDRKIVLPTSKSSPNIPVLSEGAKKSPKKIQKRSSNLKQDNLIPDSILPPTSSNTTKINDSRVGNSTTMETFEKKLKVNTDGSKLKNCHSKPMKLPAQPLQQISPEKIEKKLCASSFPEKKKTKFLSPPLRPSEDDRMMASTPDLQQTPQRANRNTSLAPHWPHIDLRKSEKTYTKSSVCEDGKAAFSSLPITTSLSSTYLQTTPTPALQESSLAKISPAPIYRRNAFVYTSPKGEKKNVPFIAPWWKTYLRREKKKSLSQVFHMRKLRAKSSSRHGYKKEIALPNLLTPLPTQTPSSILSEPVTEFAESLTKSVSRNRSTSASASSASATSPATTTGTTPASTPESTPATSPTTVPETSSVTGMNSLLSTFSAATQSLFDFSIMSPFNQNITEDLRRSELDIANVRTDIPPTEFAERLTKSVSRNRSTSASTSSESATSSATTTEFTPASTIAITPETTPATSRSTSPATTTGTTPASTPESTPATSRSTSPATAPETSSVRGMNGLLSTFSAATQSLFDFAIMSPFNRNITEDLRRSELDITNVRTNIPDQNTSAQSSTQCLVSTPSLYQTMTPELSSFHGDKRYPQAEDVTSSHAIFAENDGQFHHPDLLGLNNPIHIPTISSPRRMRRSRKPVKKINIDEATKDSETVSNGTAKVKSWGKIPTSTKKGKGMAMASISAEKAKTATQTRPKNVDISQNNKINTTRKRSYTENKNLRSTKRIRFGADPPGNLMVSKLNDHAARRWHPLIYQARGCRERSYKNTPMLFINTERAFNVLWKALKINGVGLGTFSQITGRWTWMYGSEEVNAYMHSSVEIQVAILTRHCTTISELEVVNLFMYKNPYRVSREISAIIRARLFIPEGKWEQCRSTILKEHHESFSRRNVFKYDRQHLDCQ